MKNLTLYLLIALLYSALPGMALAEAVYNAEFWQHWSDGSAEISSYETLQPRYQESRPGTAVTIFVTEPFSIEARVKADPGVHPKDDVKTVLKLNLVEDFPTGIYDYNLMTSSFVLIEDMENFDLGSPLKVSFSSQEWCGHSYSQILPGRDNTEHTLHSYFDGEADKKNALSFPKGWISEDTLLFWARGLSAPFLENGKNETRPLVRSLKDARLNHKAVDHSRATFKVSATVSSLETPAGTFSVRQRTVTSSDGSKNTFQVEEEFPHRVISWTKSDGFSATLVASKRIPYWKENSKASIGLLKEIGLKKRPLRTP